MHFISTRDPDFNLSFKQASLVAYGPQGGSFVPADFPSLPENFLASLQGLPFSQQMTACLSLFLSDMNQADLAEICDRAFGEDFASNPFEVKAINPYKLDELVIFADKGPSGSRADYAQALARELFAYWASEDETYYCLAGPRLDQVLALAAAMQADAPLSPLYFLDGRFETSDLSRLESYLSKDLALGFYLDQELTEAEEAYRRLWQGSDLRDRLAQQNIRLVAADESSPISLICQMSLILISLSELQGQELLEEDQMLDVVLTSNDLDFSLAALYVKSMGLPLGYSLIAENGNRLLSDFFRSGSFSLKRKFKASPVDSLNTIWPPAFEALLFELIGRNSQLLSQSLTDLQETGRFSLSRDYQRSWRSHIRAVFNNEKAINRSCRSLYDRSDYLLDGGAAAGFAACKLDSKSVKDADLQVVLSSYNPLWSLDLASDAIFGKAFSKDKTRAQLAELLVEESSIDFPPALASYLLWEAEQLGDDQIFQSLSPGDDLASQVFDLIVLFSRQREAGFHA